MGEGRQSSPRAGPSPTPGAAHLEQGWHSLLPLPWGQFCPAGRPGPGAARCSWSLSSASPGHRSAPSSGWPCAAASSHWNPPAQHSGASRGGGCGQQGWDNQHPRCSLSLGLYRDGTTQETEGQLNPPVCASQSSPAPRTASRAGHSPWSCSHPHRR